MHPRIARVCSFAAVLFALVCSPLAVMAQTTNAPEGKDLREMIAQFSADQRSLLRTYRIPTASSRQERMAQFYKDSLAALKRVDFDDLNQDGKIDYVAFQHYLTHQLHGLTQQSQQYEEMEPLLPFAKTIAQLEDSRRRMETPKGEQCASTLAGMVKEIARVRKAEEAGLAEGDKAKATSAPGLQPIRAKRTVARRAARTTNSLRKSLQEWYQNYSGYDPNFTWWVNEPYKEAV